MSNESLRNQSPWFRLLGLGLPWFLVFAGHSFRAFLLLFLVSLRLAAAPGFVNFETAPIHPLALSPDGGTLVACNLADGRLMIFNVTSGIPVLAGEVSVGIDPASVRFRTTNEVWVVNTISSTLSIVDIARRQVVATLQTLPGPADIVFAGTPLRAFVSCARVNKIQVFNPDTRQEMAAIEIDGELPKALAVSSDGTKVYAAIFESGNDSTILAPPITQLDNPPEPGPLGDPDGPSQGRNPPPNSGAAFDPPINPEIPPEIEPPLVGHIVKKNHAGRWMDDNSADWTEYVSGTNAFVSGRLEDWDLPDHDVAVINAATFEVEYISGLMNICMDLAVNPASGAIAVVGTDGTNERRFEPNVRATFLRVNLAVINATNQAKTIKDLNPHLTYAVRTLPQSQRDQSIGDPRAIIWNANGARAYVTGMGSRSLVTLDANGNRVTTAPVELGDGPTGMALDEPRGRLYVLNRFSASVSVVDTASHAVLTNVTFFDPTPASIRLGRRHFYDTRRNSGLGHTACGSCHVDGRMDRLAWDLGDPSGSLLTITNFDAGGAPYTRTYHPMKGPMVTQTMQDIIGHEPFHWRGDRVGIEDFNQTFPALLGRDERLTATEMQEFKAFLASLTFPPNLTRNLDDTLSTNVVLLAVDGPDGGGPSPNGNAVRGRDLFNSGRDVSCTSCHSMSTGLSFPNLLATGPNGESNLSLFNSPRSAGLLFKAPQLRNMGEKLGLNYRSLSSRAGFGFTHDGRADTLPDFLLNSVAEAIGPDAQDIPDIIAFILSMSGTDPDQVSEGGDVATATGKQITITSPSRTPWLNTLIALAETPGVRVELVAHGSVAGTNHSWLYAGTFLSDRHGEELSLEALLALASEDNPLTLTLVPEGTGRRIAIDRDDDGYFDQSEIDIGWDPRDANAHGTNLPPELTLSTNNFLVHPGMRIAFTASAIDPDPGQSALVSLAGTPPEGAAINSDTGEVEWTVPVNTLLRKLKLYVRATDDGSPPMIQTKTVSVEIVPLRIRELAFEGFYVRMHWDAVPGLSYHLEAKSRLEQDWQTVQTGAAFYRLMYMWHEHHLSITPESFFRVRFQP